MSRVCAFWDDEPGEDGFVRVSRMHHQPDQLDPAMSAAGLICTPGRPPKTRSGWNVSLWVNPETGGHDWRTELDAEYREPMAEYLMQLPVLVRIAARASDDPVIVELLHTMDMLLMDSAARGIHPAGRASREALGYLVHVGMLDRAVMDQILSPFAPQ